ncbi:MAG: lysophospholipid acyltransferase family protein, partial [Thermodesulfobacteriota bacterium]|nr:lysophospholipid acyltransferase family protein [Thermodesulfobacteriota bacterium]
GSFTLISGKLSRIGYTLAYVLRKPENPKLADFLTNLQERLGVHFISDKPRHKSAVECVKALSSGKAIYLMCDVRVNPQNGVEVNFFNRPAYTFTGPVILSMRTGAPIVPLVIVQEGKKKHKILVGDIIPLELTDDKQLDIKRNTENIVRTTEAYIRRYPEQYWWLHNRWNLKKEEMDPQSN